MHTSLVIIHKNLGVYLGPGMPCQYHWSNENTAGRSSAFVFHTYHHAETFMQKYMGMVSVSKEYRIMEVDHTVYGHATMEECIAAGVGGWDSRSALQRFKDSTYH